MASPIPSMDMSQVLVILLFQFPVTELSAFDAVQLNFIHIPIVSNDTVTIRPYVEKVLAPTFEQVTATRLTITQTIYEAGRRNERAKLFL